MNEFWWVRTHTCKKSSIFWMMKMSNFAKSDIFIICLNESMDELFIRTHIPESYFNGFFRSCRTFWLLTIIPSDQNWSTYVTMKVIVNQENREKSEIIMILNDFHCHKYFKFDLIMVLL